MTSANHWETIYSEKQGSAVSWYREHLERSLSLIEACNLTKDCKLIDVGGGASTLVDDLLDLGYQHVTVLDLANAALAQSQNRLGARAQTVTWIHSDITAIDLGINRFDLWHDRAVFHFLTDPSAITRYVETMANALKVGGYAVMSTFGLNGPEKCSGLPVCRYDAAGLASAMGGRFHLLNSVAETHTTPWGSEQAFTFCRFQRVTAQTASSSKGIEE